MHLAQSVAYKEKQCLLPQRREEFFFQNCVETVGHLHAEVLTIY